MAHGKEPMLLIDRTTSLTYGIVPGSSTSRESVLKAAVQTFVTKLAEADSAGASEVGGGGVRAIGFAKTTSNPGGYIDLDDLNPSNFSTKWAAMPPNGRTYIMPGFNQVMAVYEEEFGTADPPPDIALAIVTDGALEDDREFEQALTRIPANMTVEIVVVGQGDDNYGAVDAYQRIASRSGDRIHVTSLVGNQNANDIAGHLLQAVS